MPNTIPDLASTEQPLPGPHAIARLREVRWLFFDVGYTILDETPAWQEQFERLARASTASPHGQAVTVDQLWETYRDACASFAPGQWRRICERVATSPASVREWMLLSQGWRHDLETPYPRIGEALAQLASRYHLGVIANQAHGTRDRLERHDLWQHFRVIASSAEAGVSKPDPKIFELALREANIEPWRAAMVGDRLDNDVAPANRLGMLSVHVRQGGSAAQRPRDDAERATLAVDSVPQLAALLVGEASSSSDVGLGS